MAEFILTMFVYIFILVLVVAGVEWGIALAQLIKDIPFVRKRIWFGHERRNRGLQNAHI